MADKFWFIIRTCILRPCIIQDLSPDWPWGPPSLLYNGYRIFPGGKEQLGGDSDPSSPSTAVVMNE